MAEYWEFEPQKPPPTEVSLPPVAPGVRSTWPVLRAEMVVALARLGVQLDVLKVRREAAPTRDAARVEPRQNVK